MQELAAVGANVALNHTHACVMLVAPAVSENRNANVCTAPLSDVGDTESAVTVDVNVALTFRVPVATFPAASRAVTVTMLFADCNGMSAAFQLSVPEAVPLGPVLVDHVISATPTLSDA